MRDRIARILRTVADRLDGGLIRVRLAEGQQLDDDELRRWDEALEQMRAHGPVLEAPPRVMYVTLTEEAKVGQLLEVDEHARARVWTE